MRFTHRLFPDFTRWLGGLPDSRIPGRCQYTMSAVAFCALMMFVTRQRSLRAFCKENRHSPCTEANFNRWLKFFMVPCDDEIRYVLKDVPTRSLNQILVAAHGRLERKKILDAQKFLGAMELVALDGSGQLGSYQIRCEKCLTRHPGEADRTLYMHGQLVAMLTNPAASYALPLYFEPIENNQEGIGEYLKNDCEINAAKRMLATLKTHYPKRKFCFLGDNLFAVSTLTERIEEKNWGFLFTAKPDRNQVLFGWYEYLKEQRTTIERVDKSGCRHSYSFHPQLPLVQFYNKDDITWVALVEYTEIRPTGEVHYHNTWVTNLEVTKDNVQLIAKGGRARFAAIENRAFNELKNRGYQMEHNFGHFGNLPNVFFGLSLVARLITELFCLWRPAKQWIEAVGSIRRYFERLAVLISLQLLDEPRPICCLKFDFNSS